MKVQRTTSALLRRRMDGLDKIGEEEVFAQVLEAGTIRAFCAVAFKPRHEGEKPGHGAFYRWLDEEEGRRERYHKRVNLLKGHLHLDAAESELEDVDEYNTKSKRIKIDSHMRLAGLYNRELSDKPAFNVTTNTNVTVNNFEANLAEALAQVEAASKAKREAEIPVVEAEVVDE